MITEMSNKIPKTGPTFFCADCSASDPQWASLNKGVLICSECCHIHRNLGRHVSQVRSLKKGTWNSNQLELMYVLYSNGSNNIWEHSLLDPQTSTKVGRKPRSSDPVFPIKENFIKAKYAQMAFTIRPAKDDCLISQEDLNRQLWSCVRTAHVETTLRLLALGADPNYADPEKKNAPLHISAKEGQSLQVELLWIYGADAGQLNAADLTPSQVAKLENHNDLSARLEELQFEVTNRLSMYLCGRRPDHSKEQYFLIPDLVGGSDDSTTFKRSQQQLCAASCSQFERLVQDVYDEVDRRETATAWNVTMQGMHNSHLGNDQCIAVFLPPNPDFSATRNQLRQKLAKFTSRDFAILIIDILNEAKRRYFGLPNKNDDSFMNKTGPDELNLTSDDSEFIMTKSDGGTRDYDEVADSPQGKRQRSESVRRLSERKSGLSDSILQAIGNVSMDDYLYLKEKVLTTESSIASLEKGNAHILRILSDLQSNIDRINTDNIDLHLAIKKLLEKPHQDIVKAQLSSVSSLAPDASNLNNFSLTRSLSSSYQTVNPARPPIEPLRIDNHNQLIRIDKRRNSLVSSSHYPPTARNLSHRNGSAPPTEYSSGNETVEKDHSLITNRTTGSEKISRNKNQRLDFQEIFDTGVFPDNLIVETEVLTHTIKLLLTDAQYGKLQCRASDHAYAIALQINRLMNVIPSEQKTPAIENCLQEMLNATVLLSAKCNSPTLSVDDTCNAAYAVAKAAKQLLVNVHQL